MQRGITDAIRGFFEDGVLDDVASRARGDAVAQDKGNVQPREPRPAPLSAAPEVDPAALDTRQLALLSARRGRTIRRLRAAAAENRLPTESYGLEHVRRVLRFEARQPYRAPRHREKCAAVHGPGCRTCACRTCHFCRHKWADELVSECACRDLLGSERGTWCGTCLWTRMGQNIHEALADPAWRCPPCLDLCNCSGLGCSRCRAGWAPTGILNAEHRDCGFKSAAHYLVMTQFDERTAAEPIPDMAGGTGRPRGTGGWAARGAPAVPKRARLDPRISEAHERQERLRSLLLGGLAAALAPPATSLEARAAGDAAFAGLSLGDDQLEGDGSGADDLGGGDDEEPEDELEPPRRRPQPETPSQGLGRPGGSGGGGGGSGGATPAQRAGRGSGSAPAGGSGHRSASDPGAAGRGQGGAIAPVAEGPGESQWAGPHGGLSPPDGPRQRRNSVFAALGRMRLAAHRPAKRSCYGALRRTATVWVKLFRRLDNARAREYIAGVVGDLLRRAVADIDEPAVINALAAAPGLPAHDLCSAEALGAVLGLMDAAAEVLPPEDVRYDVVRRLTGLEPFIDFAASDPAARGALLGGCFRVLDTLAARGLDPGGLAGGVADYFGAAAAELDELDAVGTSTEAARERCALLRFGHDAGEQLVGGALEHIGTVVTRLGPAAEALLVPEVLGLLDPGRPVYAQLRRKVLLVVHAAVAALGRGPPAGEAAGVEWAARRARLAGALMQGALPHLDAAVCRRYRVRGRGAAAALDAVLPAGARAADARCDVDLIGEASAAVAAQVQALAAAAGKAAWPDLVRYAQAPFGDRLALHALPPHRAFAANFLTRSLQAFPEAARAASAAARAPLLRAWLHALADVDLRATAARLTDAMAAAAPELFAAAEITPAAVRADQAGVARAALAHAVFRALVLNPEWRGQLLALARGLADVLARRSRGDGGGDTNARGPRRRTREAALAALAVGVAEGAGLRGACPHASEATCACGELHLLAALAPAAHWACQAAVQLQRWAAALVAAGDANPNPNQGPDAAAAARREAAEWAASTAMQQLGPLLRVLARVSNAAGAPAARDPRRQVLELLRAVMAIGTDGPAAGTDATAPADTVLFHCLAAALVPGAAADPADPDLDPADARRAAWLVHYVAGTFLRRCLLRAALPSRAAERAGVNTGGALRGADFKWELGRRAIGFLTGLAAGGGAGVEWAAAAAPPLRAILAIAEGAKPSELVAVVRAQLLAAAWPAARIKGAMQAALRQLGTRGVSAEAWRLHAEAVLADEVAGD
ncbi:hypothetical protein WJX81_001508 [Elliptochloris bilobata]|uniref:Zinc-finger domain-containing protein n=1 Tax=Elliptochloris bilobata TaxID=381761 RepID=A0AAW1QKL4_9CHLO